MTAPSDNAWREKYLNALDEQEKLEKRFATETELLRRALVRVSVAAEGQDQSLDELLSQLRDQLRGSIKGDPGSLFSRLDQVAINFESHKEESALTIREAITDTIKPLQKFKISRGSKKGIEEFLSQLPARSKKIHLYPALLQQLSQIQKEVLDQIEQPKPAGLFDKLLGGKKTENVTENDSVDQRPTASNEKSVSNKNAEDVALPNSNTARFSSTQNANSQQDISKSSHPGLTPEFVERITEVLSAFLGSIENEIAIKTQAESIRQQLDRGLAVDAVIPTLENLRNLVMEAYLATNAAFANYLNSVNLELSEIYSIVGNAVSQNQHQQDAGQALQHSMMQGMKQLENHAANATDLAQLKSQVKSQIDHIKQALDNYQQSAKTYSLGDQLAELSQKIKALEVESEKNRDNLKAQRHKAMTDPLTELPNRQAYNERAATEVQRWQRYGRPLTIAVFDIDHFKKINDNYGHQAGDRVLKVIGRSIAKRLREVDFFCRFGGEEFVALMPETSAEQALPVLDKIRDAIANAAFNYKEQPLNITLSIGLTDFQQKDSLESAFERADQALYQAKQSGRNQVKKA
jgi:diguanylate cyclase